MDIALRTFFPRRIRLIIEKVIQLPASGTVFTFVFFAYFLLTSGIIYDFINEPQSTGTTRDKFTGKDKPQPILPYRLNGQYIIEGMVGGMLFSLGGLSFIFLDKAHDVASGKVVRYLLFFGGLVLLAISYNVILLLMRIKLPSYLIYT